MSYAKEFVELARYDCEADCTREKATCFRCRVANDIEDLSEALADVVEHARPAFARTPFRKSLDKAKELLKETK